MRDSLSAISDVEFVLEILYGHHIEVAMENVVIAPQYFCYDGVSLLTDTSYDFNITMALGYFVHP